MFGGNGLSLADIAAVTRNNNGNGDGFGGNNGWWIIIILLAIFGWGRGGYGNNDGQGSNGGSNGGGTVIYPIGADIQRSFDTSSITAKLDGLSNGICSLGYDQLNQMNNLNTNLMQGNFNIASQMRDCCCNIENTISQQGYNNERSISNLGYQVKDCCCNIEKGQMQADYNRATDTCTITTAIDRMADRIIQNDNANFRALHDENVAARFEAKDAQISALQQQLNQCWVRENNAAQTTQIIGALQQKPAEAAYIVPNPNTGYYYPPQYYYNRPGCCNQQQTCCNNNFGF